MKAILFYLLLCLSVSGQVVVGLPPVSGQPTNPIGGMDNTNLVAWWPFDVNGSSSADVIGGYTITFSGGTPTSVVGMITNAVDFTSSEYGVSTVNANTLGASAGTVMGWLYAVNFSTQSGNNVALSDFDGANGINLRIDTAGTELTGYIYPNNERATASFSFVNATWYHIALTWSVGNNTVAIYLNGAQVGTTTCANGPAASTHNLTVNQRGDLGDFPAAQYEDDLRFYSVPKTAAQINYTYQRGLLGLP